MTAGTAARRSLLLGAACALLATAPPDEPDGYRIEAYNAPTPATLQGATVLSTERAHALWASGGAVFVDVLPRAPRPPNLPAGTLFHQRPHADIPGSVWLADTGYGALPPAMEAYFANGLSAATGGDRDRPLVIYCKPDCWMSWNAAKRAVALGYTHVGWYPDGVEGWTGAGLPVAVREPEPRPAQ